MPRNKSLIPLSHDHHHGLKLANLLKKNAPGVKGMPDSIEEKIKYTVKFYKNDLLKHFQSEEEILFPFVKGIDPLLDNMLEEACAEHKKIKVLVKNLENSAEPSEAMNDLGRLLESHIRKEERTMFPRIEFLLSEEKLSELEGRITAVKQDKHGEK